MKSSKEKVIADCEWAISKILSQGYTTVTSMQFFKDVIAHLKHPQEIVRCKDCVNDGTSRCPCHYSGDPHIDWDPDGNWFRADGERKEGR